MEAEEGTHVVWGGDWERCTSLFMLYIILSYCLCQLPGLAAGIDKLLLQVGRDKLHPIFQPHEVGHSLLFLGGGYRV